jgi:hypothetical protein
MNFISSAQARLKKMYNAIQEDIWLSDFTTHTARSIALIREPFEHIVVDDFFLPHVYEQLEAEFNRALSRGLSEEKHQQGNRFHRFNMDYDGYVYKPIATLEKTSPLRIVYSLEWNRLFEKIFNESIGLATDFAFHHHPPGDKTGFVHHDKIATGFNTSFRLGNGVVWSHMPPTDVRFARKIAIIIYLDDGSWEEGDGGETGLYLPDKTTLAGKVAPRRNRLFAFHISDISHHAFQTNKKVRNSLIQWFHAEQ